jgi:hypothetical protein
MRNSKSSNRILRSIATSRKPSVNNSHVKANILQKKIQSIPHITSHRKSKSNIIDQSILSNPYSNTKQNGSNRSTTKGSYTSIMFKYLDLDLYSAKISQKSSNTTPYSVISKFNDGESQSKETSMYSQYSQVNTNDIQNLIYKPNSNNLKRRLNSRSQKKNISNISLKVKTKNHKKISKRIGLLSILISNF